MTAWRVYRAYDIQLGEARIATANLARSGADQAHASIQAVDIVLQDLSERLKVDGTTSVALERLHAVLMKRVSAVPELHHLVVFSAAGDALTTSFEPMPPVNVADRAYFISHRTHQGLEMLVGPPIQNRADGRWSISLSRRFNQVDGTFGGVVVAIIDCDVFERFYASFDIGPNGSMSLLNDQGIFIARQPPPSNAEFRAKPAPRSWQAREASGNVKGASPVDGITRFFSYRAVDQLPLIVVVGLSEDDVFAVWRRDAWIALVVCAVISVSVCLLGWGIVRQIKKHEIREIIVRRSEAQHRLLVGNTSDAITCLDLDLKRTYISPVFQKLFGYDPATLLGTSAASTMHPDDVLNAGGQLKQLASGMTNEAQVTNRIRHKDGRMIWVEANFSLVRDPESGQPASIICAIRDVSERKRAEAAVSEANDWLALAEHVAGLGHWRLEQPSGRLHWSPQIYSIYGLDPASGPPALEHAIGAYHPDDRAIVQKAVEQALADRAGFAVTVRLMRTDGQLRHVQAKAVVQLGPDGETSALFGVFLDVTEQIQEQALLRAREDVERVAMEKSNRELESLTRQLTLARDAAERGNRAKSRFLAGISHELRTPLNGILGYARLISMDGGLTPIQSERLAAMLGAGRHLLDMINRVLDLSEIEAERVELRITSVDLREIARACIDLVGPAAQEKGLSLTLSAESDVPCRVLIDSMRLRQVMLNLLGNAVKFTTLGSVAVTLRLSAGGSCYRLEVADTGPGIADDHRSRLFQEFDRLEAENSGPIEGAGLGLALSARLATLLGGNLGHDHNAGGGSVFWLELPLVSADDVQQALSPMPIAPHEAPPTTVSPLVTSTRSLHILVVDDVAMNRDIAAAFLRSGGYRTTAAESGVEAIAAARLNNFDMIFMDVRMPGMDGLEATRKIRALGGVRGRVPIVALTAQAFAEQIVECRAAGMNSHLLKPYSPAELLSAVASATRAASYAEQTA